MTSTTNWFQIITLYVAGTLAAFQYAKMPWMVQGLLLEHDYSQLEQAILLSTIGTMGAIFGAFAGALCQKVGIRRALLAGLAIAIIGAAMPLLSNAYIPLIIARIVESTGHMAIVVTAPTLMLLLSAEKDRPRIMTVWSCYFTLTFMGVAAIAPIINDMASWQGFAILHIILLMLVTVGITTLIKKEITPNHQNSPQSHLLLAQWRLLSNKRLLIIPLTFIGYTLLFVSLVSVLPSLLSSDSEMQYRLGFLFPSCALLGTIIALFSLHHKIRPWKLVRAATVVLVIASITMILIGARLDLQLPLVALIFFALGLLPAGIISSLPELISSNDPDMPLVNGGLVQFGNLGNFIGPPILALLISQLSWTGIGIYLMSGTVLVIVCLAILVQQLNASSITNQRR